MTDDVRAPVSPVSGKPNDGGSNAWIVAWCALSGLGVLLAVSTMLSQVAGALSLPQDSTVTSGIPIYVGPIITVLSLVFWHLTPNRASGWLLVAGAVLAFPIPLSLLVGNGYQPSQLEVMSVLASPILITVAVLGAGVRLATSGRRGLGETIMGAAVLLQWSGVILGDALFATTVFTALGIVMTILVIEGLFAGVVAVMRPGLETEYTPDWRVTIAGSLGVLASVVPPLMGLDLTPDVGFSYLQVAVIVLVIAVVLGVLAGWRAHLGAIVMGMINGVIVILLLSTMGELHDMVGVTLAGLGVGLGIGLIAAYTSSRSVIAISGLASVALAFFVLMIVLDPESDHFADAWEIATPVLLVVMLIAALAAVATIGDALAEKAESPAVILGLAIPFQLAGLLLFLGLQSNVEFSGPATNALLIPSAVGLLIAIGALSVLVNRNRNTRGSNQEVTTG